jgi:NADH:ubiquinone reductase (H+-translocating)
MRKRSKVIIIGGGFEGLCAAQALKSTAVDVTLIDRRNYHLFQPLLYQVATGSLSPGEIAATATRHFEPPKKYACVARRCIGHRSSSEARVARRRCEFRV